MCECAVLESLRIDCDQRAIAIVCESVSGLIEQLRSIAFSNKCERERIDTPDRRTPPFGTESSNLSRSAEELVKRTSVESREHTQKIDSMGRIHGRIAAGEVKIDKSFESCSNCPMRNLMRT